MLRFFSVGAVHLGAACLHVVGPVAMSDVAEMCQRCGRDSLFVVGPRPTAHAVSSRRVLLRQLSPACGVLSRLTGHRAGTW